MRIHLRNPLRHRVSMHFRKHVRSNSGIRLDTILIASGALLLVAGFLTDGQVNRGSLSAGTHLDVSNWLMSSGLVVVASGALVALRRWYVQ
ncbi:MAG: hypothetical protein H0X38_11720 [Planctomycetes bacterium]|nr:hypothetical protein [Planctomycetota bacterium]